MGRTTCTHHQHHMDKHLVVCLMGIVKTLWGEQVVGSNRAGCSLFGLFSEEADFRHSKRERVSSNNVKVYLTDTTRDTKTQGVYRVRDGFIS